MEGKTIGIVGIGEIGKVIAKKCKLLGMTVLGTGPRPVQNEFLDRFYLIQDLQEMLPQVDFLILICPLTAKSRGMIGEKELQAMKDSAYLFNLARGPVVNNQALLKALKEGWIAGAGHHLSTYVGNLAVLHAPGRQGVCRKPPSLRSGRASALSVRLGQRILVFRTGGREQHGAGVFTGY